MLLGPHEPIHADVAAWEWRRECGCATSEGRKRAAGTCSAVEVLCGKLRADAWDRTGGCGACAPTIPSEVRELKKKR